MASRASVTGLSLPALTEILGSRTRALAARRWLFSARPVPQALPLERIPGVAPEAWQKLTSAADMPDWRLAERAVSVDGTIKYALELGNATIETVLIPAEDRSTVCVSSQSGCSRHCSFCATATLGFRRQLEAGEI